MKENLTMIQVPGGQEKNDRVSRKVWRSLKLVKSIASI